MSYAVFGEQRHAANAAAALADVLRAIVRRDLDLLPELAAAV